MITLVYSKRVSLRNNLLHSVHIKLKTSSLQLISHFQNLFLCQKSAKLAWKKMFLNSKYTKKTTLLSKASLFLDRSCVIFSWLNFMVMLCHDWVCYDFKFESTEDHATAI